jgi:hypothetical protein
MTSVKASSAGGVPSGFEIVGVWPAAAETTGRTVAPLSEPDIFIPPRIVMAMRATAKKPARILRTEILIF